jgi:hypothetical protein
MSAAKFLAEVEGTVLETRWDAPRRNRKRRPYPPRSRPSVLRGMNKKPQPHAQRTTARTKLNLLKASFSERSCRILS